MFRAFTAILGVLLAGWPALAIDTGDTCSDAETDIYIRSITQDVIAAWKLPYKDRSISCRVLNKQDIRGEVLNVGIANCGDDPRIHKSVIDAGYRASPTPLPTNRACFSRDIIIEIEFRAQDFD